MAADSALDFLAQLAAMKAGGASTAYQGGMSDDSDEEPKKKKKKKKKTKKSKDSKTKPKRGGKTKEVTSSKTSGKKGKKSKGKKGKKGVAPSTAITDDIEEEDEKTPEPPSNLSEIEKRKFRLKYARRKLEKRKKEREEIRLLKANKRKMRGNSSDILFGKTYISEFLQELETEQSHIESKLRERLRLEEAEESANREKNDLLSGLGLTRDAASSRKRITDKSLDRNPGRINTLSVGDSMSHFLIHEKRIATSEKHSQTDADMFIDYLRSEFLDDFVDSNGNMISMDVSVMAGLSESTLSFGFPRELWEIEEESPSPTAVKIRQKERAENERKEKILIEKERRRLLRENQLEKRKNISHLTTSEANELVQRGDFLDNFNKKTKWIQRMLGINAEYFGISDGDDGSDDGDAYGDADGGDDRAVIPRNILKFRKTFCSSSFAGRAIGNISFSESNRDWFSATYFVSSSSGSGANYSYNRDNKGCIAIWNFMLRNHPEYVLSAQNMITSCHFHRSDPFLMFGSTINGQILMWDLRNNKSSPIERSNFSSGHNSPVFTMSFLPNIQQNRSQTDVEHILSVSNDGKLCIWRTDELSLKPLNESILKPCDDQSTARQIELITTCFDFSYRDYTQIVLGSDEGYLYKAEIFNQNNNSDQSLTIKESINAHAGPITNVQFFPIHRYNQNYNFKENVAGLYLTASYDWSCKLWHNKIQQNKENKAIAIATFDQMSDYVYDVKWNIGGKPGVFACCDAQAHINIFDLARDFKHPIITKQPIKITKRKNVAATTLQWTNDGKHLMCGDSDGNLLLYNVHKSISHQTLESCEALQSVANKYIV